LDSNRFDNWTRNRALRLSRREALRITGASGVAAAFSAMAPETLAQTTCSLTVHGETAGGPSTSTTFDGTLQFSIGPDGAFSQASFTLNGGAAGPASGSLAGRAFDLVISLGSGQSLTLSGAADKKGPDCPTAAAGILSGPQPGDLGAWQATGSGAAHAPVTTSGQTTIGNQSPGSNCQSPSFACGPNCCPGGATCTDANQGICACPNGTEQCGTNCVSSCSDGQPLDLDSCTCPDPQAACIQNQQTCQNHGQCCSGYCGGGTCFDCAGKVCGDFGCIDPSKDSQNCGNCGNVCIAPNGVCVGGVCGCVPDGSPCSFDSDCCSQGCNVSSGTCGCVGIGGSCSFTEDCCQPGGDLFATCFFQTNTCTSIPKPCESNTECLSGNCADGSCQ
jgi:hypothetical protein